MTDEEWKAWEIGGAGAMMNAAPKPSLERRLDWLEADASVQRTVILRMEKAAKLICKSLWALFAVLMILALKVIT
jgi:hypothetical protein